MEIGSRPTQLLCCTREDLLKNQAVATHYCEGQESLRTLTYVNLLYSTIILCYDTGFSLAMSIKSAAEAAVIRNINTSFIFFASWYKRLQLLV